MKKMLATAALFGAVVLPRVHAQVNPPIAGKSFLNFQVGNEGVDPLKIARETAGLGAATTSRNNFLSNRF